MHATLPHSLAHTPNSSTSDRFPGCAGRPGSPLLSPPRLCKSPSGEEPSKGRRRRQLLPRPSSARRARLPQGSGKVTFGRRKGLPPAPANPAWSPEGDEATRSRHREARRPFAYSRCWKAERDAAASTRAQARRQGRRRAPAAKPGSPLDGGFFPCSQSARSWRGGPTPGKSIFGSGPPGERPARVVGLLASPASLPSPPPPPVF